MPRCQIVGNVIPVDHGNGDLQDLKVEAVAEHCWSIGWHRDEATEINGARNVHEAYVLLTAQIEWVVNHREEQGRICGNGCVIDQSTDWIMEQGYCKVLEVKPGGVEEAAPVMHQAVDDGAAVELIANSIKEQTRVGRQGFKGALGNLKCMCAFKHRHAWLNLGVQGCREAPNLYQN